MRRRSAASASRARVDAFSFTSSRWRAASHSSGDTMGGAFNRRSAMCYPLQKDRCCHEDDCGRPKDTGRFLASGKNVPTGAPERHPQGDCLEVVVGVLIRQVPVQEVVAVQRRVYRLERPRRAREVEATQEVISALIGGAQRWEPEGLLDELQDTAELVPLVRNVGGLRVWGDDDQRNAKAELV